LKAKEGDPVGEEQKILVRLFAFIQHDFELISENQQNDEAGKCED
jgi:hypothetical protein